ncbi:MAG TPA: hypothetical protein VF077_01040 [Nitrospiraceae bacterium]
MPSIWRWKYWYTREQLNNIFFRNEVMWGRLPRRKKQRRRRQAHAFIAGKALCGKGYNNEVALYKRMPTGLVCAACQREIATRVLQADSMSDIGFVEVGVYDGVRFIETPTGRLVKP